MIRAEWFAGLGHPVAFDFLESSDQFVERAVEGAHHDGTRYVVFAWEFAALMEGYSQLGWQDRVRAQEFLTAAMGSWSLDAKTMQLEWMLGESAFALHNADLAARSIVSATKLATQSP